VPPVAYSKKRGAGRSWLLSSPGGPMACSTRVRHLLHRSRRSTLSAYSAGKKEGTRKGCVSDLLRPKPNPISNLAILLLNQHSPGCIHLRCRLSWPAHPPNLPSKTTSRHPHPSKGTQSNPPVASISMASADLSSWWSMPSDRGRIWPPPSTLRDNSCTSTARLVAVCRRGRQGQGPKS
jgi:hypothetical protein